MKLNKHGMLARFYLWWWNKLPDDLCTFWWGLVWAATKTLIVGAILLWFAVMAGWSLFILGRAGWHHPKLAGIVVGGLALIGLVIWRRHSLHFEVVREVADVVRTKALSTKQQFCPRIEWK